MDAACIAAEGDHSRLKLPASGLELLELVLESHGRKIENREFIEHLLAGVLEHLEEIRALEGGAIVDGASCKVDYTASALTSKKIMGATNTSIRAQILFTGKNIADDTPVIINCWEGLFTPDSAFDLLADDFGEITLTGKLKTPVGKTSPFEVEFLDLA